DRERARRAGWRRRPPPALGGGGQGRRHGHAVRHRQWTGRAGGGAAAPLRAVLLAEVDGHRARPGDRQAHDRGARRTHRGGAGARCGPAPGPRAAARDRGGGGVVSELGTGQLVAAGVYLLGALACAIVLQLSWIYLRSGSRRGWLLGVFLVLNWLGPAYF